MFHIAICEDEKIVLEFETSLIKKWAEERGVVISLETFISAEQFLFESEDAAPFDLLIFDIQMKNMNGMELAKTLRKRGCQSELIFVTGVKDYAIEGYEVGAVRYLLKPLKADVLNSLLDSVYSTHSKTDDFFILEQGSQKEKIPFKNIIYMEARGHYVFLKTDLFEREWKSSFSEASSVFNSDFFCLRRGLIVNLNHISKITRTDCILDSGETLPVARNVYKDLNEAFINHYKNTIGNGGEEK